MRQIFILSGLLLYTLNFVFAQCGYHPPEPQAQTRQRSTVVVSEETVKAKALKKLATISKKEAKKIATYQYPGKVKEANLELEEGTLVWKLEVKGTEGQKEVFIDPANGTFLGYGLTR